MRNRNNTAEIITAIAALIAAIAGLLALTVKNDHTQNRGSTPGSSGSGLVSPQNVSPVQTVGLYCCDLQGFRRCPIIQALPVGSPCFCPNQGNGFTCQ